MANPQREDGHIDIANEIAEAFAKNFPGHGEAQVLWAILRKTYGWHKKSDLISISQIQQLTGLSRSRIIECLQNLEAKNMIVVKREKGDNGLNLPNEISFQKNYDLWVVAEISKQYSKDLESRRNRYQKSKEEVVAEIKSSSGKGERVVAETEKGSEFPLPTKETLYKRKYTKESNTYTRILNFWNSLKIIEHKDTPKLRRKIIASLKIYTPEELEDAMKNYAYILTQPDRFYWTYKWQLRDFLDRGVERFLPVNFKEKDYLKRVYKSKAELEEERSMGILSKAFKEEEVKENE